MSWIKTIKMSVINSWLPQTKKKLRLFYQIDIIERIKNLIKIGNAEECNYLFILCKTSHYHSINFIIRIAGVHGVCLPANMIIWFELSRPSFDDFFFARILHFRVTSEETGQFLSYVQFSLWSGISTAFL